MIAKIKFYSYDNNNHETFRGSFRTEFTWTSTNTVPHPGLTLIVPTKQLDGERLRTGQSFRFYVTHIIHDLRNRLGQKDILIEKRRHHWRHAEEQIGNIKAILREQGWEEFEIGKVF